MTYRRASTALACVAAMLALGTPAGAEDQDIPLFDGESFDGWNGDTRSTWRIENGAIAAGSLAAAAPRNEFLATDREFEDFELRVRFKINGDDNVNAGVQFRTRRIPDHHEVIGYQADIGPGWWGALYDESRRKRLLAKPDAATVERALAAVAEDGWHTYRIRAVGRRVRLWLNGVLTVDYTEPDASIPTTGVIALQIHGGMRAVIAYKEIVITPLPERE